MNYIKIKRLSDWLVGLRTVKRNSGLDEERKQKEVILNSYASPRI